MGKDFIIGVDQLIEETANGVYRRWEHIMNVFFGRYPIFFYFVSPENALGLPTFQILADVRCAGNVWYFNLGSYNSFGYDEFGTACDNCLDSKVGVFEQCFPSAGCNGRALGQAIPLGSPSQLASVPPYPQVNHINSESCDGIFCPEKPAIDFVLSENC
jgi:hypothetical protein